MTEFEMVKKHYTHIAPIIENAVYNEGKDITEYFGQKVMAIYNGHGGSGWDVRTLGGFYENDDNYLVLERYDSAGKLDGQSLVEKSNWFLFLVLPENIKKMDNIYREGRIPAPIRPSHD